MEAVRTIDELRVRKRELLARKKYELELQARGGGDNLALFMVREELLDVNDQLRALTAGRRKTGGKTSADWAKDRRQYQDWQKADTADEDDRTRARAGRAAMEGLDLLPRRQREVLERHLAGENIPAIAAALGVNKSTVSRTLSRAKKNLRKKTERALAAARLTEGGALVDLRALAAAEAVFLALTPKQTAYFYLYYSECLTLREIEALTGTDHAAVCRTLRRALRNIGALLGGAAAVLEHPEALDELAYQAYCRLEDHPELLPEGTPALTPYRPGEGKRARGKSVPLPPAETVSVRVRRGRGQKPPGKLLAALLERREAGGGVFVFRWLETVFTALLKGLRKEKKTPFP